MKTNVAFLHGRFGPHIMHGRLAKSINGEFHMIDAYKKWNDGEKSKLFLLYAWLYNAFAFKNIKKYQYFLVSGPHFSPIFMKLFRLKKEQKLIAHLGDETMYFLYSNWYSKLTKNSIKWALNNYDALFCEGQMAADLAKLNGINSPKIYTTYLGVPRERQTILLSLTPQLEANNFVFISAGPSGWRTHYKGLDLMLSAYQKAFELNSTITFTILGEWSKEVQENLQQSMSQSCKASIDFVGQTNEIDKYLAKGSFYFHTARGDAFPTVVLEAMSAGLIPFVSEWTGSKEVVRKIDKNLVLPLKEDVIVRKIIELSNLSIQKRQELSEKCRLESKHFTEEFAMKHYQETFAKFKQEVK